MKAEEQTKLNETLVKVFKLTEEQLATLYNEAGDLTDLKVVTEADAARVAKFNTDKTSQYNRGIKEGAEKIEKAVKEKYEVESDLVGIELMDQVVLKQTETVQKANPKDITKHPEYVKLEAGIAKQLKEKDKEWEGKLALKEAEFKKEKLFEKIKDKALVNLEGRKPNLPADPKKAQVWKETYLNELRSGNYQEGEDGVPIVLDKEGNVMKDKHGNPVTFDEFEKSISDKYFEYPVSSPKDSPGNKPPIGGPPNAGDPKTVDECLIKLKDPKITPEDRKKWTDLMDNLIKQK
jgi:hypothetical protein